MDVSSHLTRVKLLAIVTCTTCGQKVRSSDFKMAVDTGQELRCCSVVTQLRCLRGAHGIQEPGVPGLEISRRKEKNTFSIVFNFYFVE